MVEAETRLDDLQALERRIYLKQRDLGIRRVILLVADTRHNRAVLEAHPELLERFPVSTRACLLALREWSRSWRERDRAPLTARAGASSTPVSWNRQRSG